ncbi:hypothetical protein [Opitutus sp. GAS368]|uniref:dTMP kinase n=1 Tax=Opitutus sp. GAS368 TaxID=1882749 RepID=UPI00087A1FD6|nr:hypothetical protein [Opitutus sp. GAS368]SDS02145.1 Thymidylate kinase [Opitutus sp. GAS368]
MNLGHLIVVEGPENTGKTTLAQVLPTALAQRGVHAEYMSFPGRGTASIGAVVYDLEHKPDRFGITALPAATRQVLHLAAHLDAIESRIKPALASGRWIVLDRYWWSMWAHGHAQGLSTTLLNQLVKIECDAWQPIKPAVIFCTLRPAPFDDPLTPQWEAVQAAYRQLVEVQGAHAPIDQLGPTQSVEDRVISCLARLTTLGVLPRL